MTAMWLIPVGVLVVSFCAMAAVMALVADEATRLARSLRRLQRVAVSTDELARAAGRTVRSVDELSSSLGAGERASGPSC